MKDLWNDIVNPYFLIVVALFVGVCAMVGAIFGMTKIFAIIGLIIIVILFTIGSFLPEK